MGRIIDISEVILELGLSASITEEERAIVGIALIRSEGALRRHLRYDPVQGLRTEFYPHQDFDYQGRTSVWESEGGEAYLRRIAEASTSELQVRHIPIRSSPSMDLRIDYDGRSGAGGAAFGADTQKTEGTDFWPNYDGLDDDGNSICRDGILRSIGRWPTTPGTVKVAYTAGYTQKEIHGQGSLVDASPIMEAAMNETVRRAKKALVANRKHTAVGFVAGPMTSENLGDYSYSIDSAALNRLFGSERDILPETADQLRDYINLGWCLAG